MCVSTHDFKCCCGCMTLTQATIVFGALYYLESILNAIAGQWAGFCIYATIGTVFMFVIFKPTSIGTRLCIFVTSCVLNGLSALVLLIAFFLAIFYNWEE